MRQTYTTDAMRPSIVSRRAALRMIGTGAATAVAIGAAPAVAGAAIRMVGFKDRPYQSQQFSGPGYYAFGASGYFGSRVLYATTDDHWGIALSDGPLHPVSVYVSHRSFDQVCCGICRTADEAERKAGTGRYAELAR